VMASLIVSGGFVQAIARKGSFYLGMQQLIMARHVGWRLYRGGLMSAVIVAGAALVAGSYFDAFESFVARIVALSYFVMLNALWLACALLSMRTPAWWVPAVYVCAGAVFVVARSQFEASALVAQTAAVVAALAAANALAWDAFRAAARHDSRTETIVLPRLPVLLQSLLPFFVYGVAYFAFLFADRLSAGSALPVQSGLTFGIAVDYKRGIDLAFLVFLVVAGAVECCTVLLMRFWRHTAERSANVADLRVELLRRRRKGHLAIIVVSATCAAIAASAAWRVGFLTNPGYVVFAAGSIGYSLFAAGLFDALTLFSVNRPAVVLRALLPALALNLVTGYALSHIVAAEFAVAGLVVGAAVFMLDARRGVHDALRRPDYAYSWA
ncbi:MAG TPA: hypothetical protein VJ691_03335, partial [Vicinamibacterales bacterium]|nr:hypothetical protein [Vicinamibacterales bacterium]